MTDLTIGEIDCQRREPELPERITYIVPAYNREVEKWRTYEVDHQGTVRVNILSGGRPPYWYPLMPNSNPARQIRGAVLAHVGHRPKTWVV